VSLWSADLLALGQAVDLLSAEADAFHVDVFDGHNVPDLLFGPDVVAALRKRTPVPLDVHLNVAQPDYWARRFAAVGADIITVQSAASPDPHATFGLVRSLGASPSLGLEVHEPVEKALGFFDDVDRVLVMGTAIGVKGAHLDRAATGRVSALVRHRSQRFPAGQGPKIVVDGGIRDNTVEALARAGADGVVPGSLVFGSPDPVGSVCWLHSLGPEAMV
jgi:ribulose-phosphate 3-epimerase